MRVILDVNVVISSLISPNGTPALVLNAWRDSRYSIVTSPRLLTELARALNRPALAQRIPLADAAALTIALTTHSIYALDPLDIRPWTRDPKDDYLVELAVLAHAVLVTGDRDLLEAPDLPIETLTPAAFLNRLEQMPQPPER